MKNRILVSVSVILILTAALLVALNAPSTNVFEEPEQPAKTQFVLASWDFPDKYGQGMDTITIYGNSTGSWVAVGNYEYDEPSTLDWNESVAIKLKVWSWFNSTLTGAVDTNDGKNYLRHSVIVTALGVTIFSQQNFTYSNVYPEADPMWYYVYEVVLNFLPEVGQVYTITVTYEVFY